MHQHAISISNDLIQRYDTAAPRYTSYPTAPQFHCGFNEADYREHAKRANNSLLPRDLSLYVHIPFCHSLCYFCGCNKVVTQTTNSKVNEYLDRLLREIRRRGQLFGADRLVTQIHFGGGTPNFLSAEQIHTILDEIAQQFHLDLPHKLEIGIELDPRSISPEGVRELNQQGFNRFSIGVQDFAAPVQHAVNRVQNEADTVAVIEAALKHSTSVNVDLITGLPRQTLESFAETLDKIIATGATRIAAYNFAYLPARIKAQRMINPTELPSTATRLALVALARDKLLSADYVHIGMDHYALASDSLAEAYRNGSLQRNFQGYTTHRETDLIGVGASAISNFATAYAQNEPTLSKYIEMIDSDQLPIVKGLALNEDDRIRHEVIQQLMCRHQLDLNTPVGRLADSDRRTSIADYFATELTRLAQVAEDGLIKLDARRLTITETGRFFMRPIASVFDRYLPQPKTGQILPFSRTV